jgi:hypothetical protein
MFSVPPWSKTPSRIFMEFSITFASAVTLSFFKNYHGGTESTKTHGEIQLIYMPGTKMPIV